MSERTTAQVSLANGMMWMASGEMELALGECGELTVWDYSPPRDGNSIVLVAAKGEWRSAVIMRGIAMDKTTPRTETQANTDT